jgi:hypothetical protein
MNNKGVAIRYGDVAPEAKENFYPSVNDKADFVNLSQLQQYNLNFPNYANPCELYSVVLDGTASAFPSVPENANLGLWSEQISNDDGTFTEPIVLELESIGQYSSQGLTLTFDTYNGIFATRLSIKWLRITDEGITTLAEQEYTPDNAFYFCRNQVENYNKVVITFYSINMPKNRLKLRVIDYGYGTIFYGDELRNVKLIQEIDPISTQISINTADFTLDSKSDMEYSFQQKQPLSLFFNGELKATTFVKKSTRKAKRLWSIQSEDYIGLLNSIPYYGGIYTNKNAVELLTDIFTVAKVPYSIDDVFADAVVTGYIPFTTCRDALMQVAFAIQAVVDTSNVDYVNVYKLTADDVFEKEPIKLNRIMQGQNFANDETVTSVELSIHTYTPKEVIPENKIGLFDPEQYGVGENIFIKFPEPVHGLDFSGNGEILSSSANHAIVNVGNANFRLVGYGYDVSVQKKSKKREDVGATTLEKIVSIDNATLISSANVDNVLQKCYNWLIKTNATNLKIVEGKHVQYGEGYKYGQHKYGTFKYGQKHPNIITYDKPVNVGENINAETEYLGVVGGRLIKQSFNLNGNIIVKEAVLK